MCKCDSWVVETNVHFPTDISLLFDAVRKVIQLTAKLEGITGWRQSKHLIRNIKMLMRRAQKMKRSSSKNSQQKAEREKKIRRAHIKYINETQDVLEKARLSLSETSEATRSANEEQLSKINAFVVHAHRQINQIQRRVIHGEPIPHSEKIFSVFEPHTEWICKGKAGVRQELGMRVCLLEDHTGFTLHHKVMRQQTDEKTAVEMVTAAKEKFSNVSACSFDKGFYTPANKEELSRILSKVIMPKKGKLSLSDKEEEHSEEFIQARYKHSAVESAISAMENHGLDRCPDVGLEAFERYVALAVTARNIQQLGNLILQKAQARIARRWKYNRTRAARLKASA